MLLCWKRSSQKDLKNCFHQELKNMTFLDYIGKIQQQSLFNFLHLVVRHACARSISINKRWNRTKAGIISHERQKGGTSTRRQSNLVICTWSIRPGRWTIFFRISNLVVCARRNALVKITKLNGRRVDVGSRISHGKWWPSLCDSIAYLL